MIPNEPVLFESVVSEQERIELKDHAIRLLETGSLLENVNGLNRYYNCFYNEDSISEAHKKLYRKVLSRLELTDPEIDPNLGMIISVIKPGGFIHKHSDPYGPKFKHLSHKRNVRFNVMIERGNDVSYDPHIEDVPFKVKLGDAWCFAASLLKHSTLLIVGPEYRIVYQFGFCLDAI